MTRAEAEVRPIRRKPGSGQGGHTRQYGWCPASCTVAEVLPLVQRMGGAWG